MQKHEILNRLGWEDPFEGFSPAASPESWSWHFDHPFIEKLFRKIPEPQVMVEVGTWLGGSAIQSASFYALKLNWRNFTLFCVDTWLGSPEHWVAPTEKVARSLPRIHGYPVIYEQFLSNVLYAGLQEHILPFPQTSVNASRVFYYFQLQQQLPLLDWVYIDASHDSMDVLMDMSMYWPLIRPGGVLFGDDWVWQSVSNAVKEFANQKQLKVEFSDLTWAIWKE